MASNFVAKFNALEVKNNMSNIADLSKVDGRIHDDRAKRDACYNKYHKQIFRDLLLDNLRLLQYYQQLNCNDRIACSLQRSALQTLYEIYSFELRPADQSKAQSLETLLQRELIKIINRPYGILGEGGIATDATKLEEPNSPLWELSNWSLKLTRIFIDRGLLLGEMSEVVEIHLTNLVETLNFYRMKGQSCPGSSYNLSLLAHCLSKLFALNWDKECQQRKLSSSQFICDHLFPLACEFAAKEYPATVVDPIDHYKLFKASGKLEDPEEWLFAPSNQDGNNCSAPGDHDPHLLPPTHVCLEHLIFKLVLSSNADTQDVVVEFLRQRILEDTNYYDDIDSRATADKLALMNKIVALSVLGRVEEELKRPESIVFFNMLVLPNLHHDCLLVKVCKFQLMRHVIIDREMQVELVPAYLRELIDIEDVGSSRDKHNKLFIIFTKLVSKFLSISWEREYLLSMSTTCLTHMMPLEVKSKLNLVKKIVALYRYHKIIESLLLVDTLANVHRDDPSLKNEFEHHMTRVIDSITDELLELLPNKKNYIKRISLVSLHLVSSINSRRQPLMDETVDKLLKVVEICFLDDELNKQILANGNPDILKTWNLAYLKFALKFPLKKQTQVGVLSLFDRVLEKFKPGRTIDLKNLVFFKTLLGNLAFYQVTNSSRLYTGNKGDAYDERNMLLESAHRMGKICAMCESISNSIHLVSGCIMSALMSWLSLSVAVGAKSPSTNKRHGTELDQMWQRLVRLIFTEFDIFDAKANDKINARRKSYGSIDAIDSMSLAVFQTRDNVLFAILAAFSHDPSFLESQLCLYKGPATNNESHMKKYVKFWLDVVTRPNDILWLRGIEDDSHTARSQVYISCLTLINIHRARIDSKLTFSLKGLIGQLNAARLAILKCLSELSKKAILCDSPLKNFYADSIRQLEAIGQFK